MHSFFYKYVISNKGVTRSASTKVTDIKLPTINDIPAPSGPWKDHYDARQKVYNMQLIAGITVLVGTITFVSITLYYITYVTTILL